MTGPGDGKWLSRGAVLWAMDEATGVPPHLVAALIAVARYAGEDGRSAYPAVGTIAAIIRKSDRSTRKDLAELRQLGLLLDGDQRVAKDIRPDRRPFVYDLNMPRPVVDDTPHGGSHTTPRSVPNKGSRPVAHDPAGGRTRPSDLSHTTAKEFRNKAGTASAARARAVGARAPRSETESQNQAATTRREVLTCSNCGRPTPFDLAATLKCTGPMADEARAGTWRCRDCRDALPASAVEASAAIGGIIAADPGIISPPAAVNGHGPDTCPECGQPAERYKTGRMKPHADRTGCKCSLSDRFVSTA